MKSAWVPLPRSYLNVMVSGLPPKVKFVLRVDICDPYSLLLEQFD